MYVYMYIKTTYRLRTSRLKQVGKFVELASVPHAALFNLSLSFSYDH